MKNIPLRSIFFTGSRAQKIKETANRTQQVKQAEQEANIAAANAQKLVREAEAKKQAMQLTDFPLGAFDDACDGLKLLVTAFEKMGGSH